MSVQLFDTHAHVQMDRFGGDREIVLKRAEELGVRDILNVGVDVPTSLAAIELAVQHGSCWAAIGIHPHDSECWTSETAEVLRNFAQHPKVIAIGETGLDYYRNAAPWHYQMVAFQEQIELAHALDLPLIVHNRDATDDVVTTLENFGRGVRVLLHCFNGEANDVERALTLGCMFGIGGIVTYPNAKRLREIVAALPGESILLETDAPWLAPQAYRGRRNEPGYVRATAERVAEIRGVSVETLARLTTENARRFFRLEGP